MFFDRHFNAFIFCLPYSDMFLLFHMFYGEIFAILQSKMSQSVIIGKLFRSPRKKSIFCRFPIVLSDYCGTIIEEKIMQ